MLNEKVSIILPSLVLDEETFVCLNRHLASLGNTVKRHEIQFIIIDNGSKMGVKEMEQAADIYIRKDYPMGYARAVNLGLALADGHHLVIANNDVFYRQGWLDRMLYTYENTLKCGVLMPANLQNPEKPFAGSQVIEDSHWYCLWMMSRDVFKANGYLDEFKLNWRYHDQEYSIKTRMNGFRVVRDKTVTLDFQEMTTYKKLNKQAEESEEYKIMMERYGATQYEHWVAQNRDKLNL